MVQKHWMTGILEGKGFFDCCPIMLLIEPILELKDFNFDQCRDRLHMKIIWYFVSKREKLFFSWLSGLINYDSKKQRKKFIRIIFEFFWLGCWKQTRRWQDDPRDMIVLFGGLFFHLIFCKFCIVFWNFLCMVMILLTVPVLSVGKPIVKIL